MTKTARFPQIMDLESDKPLFFFGTNNKYGPFSQWYRSSFTASKSEVSAILGHTFAHFFPEHEDGLLVFNTAEQFMMYSKAILFCDHHIALEILATNDPRSQKALGRAVRNFKDESWNTVKFAVVEFANVAKFSQQSDLKKMLLETEDRELVEAAPSDRVWGIGYSEKTARRMTSRKGWGQNLLGKALMSAREKIRRKDMADT